MFLACVQIFAAIWFVQVVNMVSWKVYQVRYPGGRPAAAILPQRLNFDVMCNILRLCSTTKTVSALSLTCRELHDAGVRELLRRPVSLRSRRQLTSFALLLYADPERRGPLLKDLTLPAHHGLSEAELRLLAWVLRTCPSIEELTLPEDGLLQRMPAVGLAIAELQHVQYLGICALRTESVAEWTKIARWMRFKCVRVVLEGECGTRTSHLLQPFTSSLRTLHATWHFHSSHPSSLVVYPHLTSLSLDVCGAVRVKPLLASFPALRSLVFFPRADSRAARLGQEPAVPVPDFEQRASNLKAWQESTVKWRSLKSVRCHFTDLYTLGIACPVQRCTVYSKYSMHEALVALLMYIQKEMRFTKLVVDVDISERNVWSNLSSGGVVSSLRRFRALELNLLGDRYEWHYKRYLSECLASCVRRISGLRYFAVNGLREVDGERLAAHLFGCRTTLEYVAFESRPGVKEYWTVTRRVSEPPLVVQLRGKEQLEGIQRFEKRVLEVTQRKHAGGFSEY